MRIVRRKNEWNRPVKTVLAAKRDRRRGNIAHLPRHLGQSHDAAEGTRVVDDVRVQRIRNGVTTLSGSNGKPIALGDLSIVSAAGDRRGAAILLRSVDPIGKPVIGGHSVKLSRWLVVPRAPGLAAIHADGRALIDAQDNSLRICGIEPHRMVVIATRSAFDRRESMPAIRRAVQILLGDVDRIRILWVHENFAHVPIPFDPAIRRGLFPGCSAIVRTIEPAIFFFRFKNQVNPLPGPNEVPFCPGFRIPCQSVAKTTRGLPGSKQRSTAPVTLSLNRTLFQMRPPSMDRKTPRSSFGPKLCPMAATSTMSGLRGSTRMRPMCRVSASPRCCHVSPPSVVFHTPPPSAPK